MFVKLVLLNTRKFSSKNKPTWVGSIFVPLNLISIQPYRLVSLYDFRSLPWPSVCCDRVCQECSQHGWCQLHGTQLSHQIPSGNDTLNISIILYFYLYHTILASLIWVNDVYMWFLLSERSPISCEFHSIVAYHISLECVKFLL